MRFEDQSPSGDRPGPGAVPPPPPPPVPADPGPRPRRRSPRSWSTPAPGGSRFERPTTERDWSAPTRRAFAAPAAPADPAAPPAARPQQPPPAPSAPGALPVDLSPALRELRELRAEVEQLRAALRSSATRDASVVTGAELAASIEALGTTLGNGMATLLTEHRNLLARDVDSAADRILEELAQRLRASASQTADAVEERQRQVLGKSLGDVSEQLELRLEQLQTDVAGLRAVMLELPDQTAISDRLDQLVDAVSATRGLTTEIAALRRRIAARSDRSEGLSEDQLDDLADRVAERLLAAGYGPAAPDEEDEGDEDDAPAKPARRTRRR